MTSTVEADRRLSLYRLLDPDVLADPYPLYHRLRREDAVHWDPFLHAWVVTGYEDVATVLREFSAARTPTAEHLTTIGMGALRPIAEVMVRQMLFLDPPEHTRVRLLASRAFTPRRVEALRAHIANIVEMLLDGVRGQGAMDVIADLARPLPAIVTAELLGLPSDDWPRLTAWSRSFAEMLGNVQHNIDRVPLVLRNLEEMTAYFQQAVRDVYAHPRDGLLHALATAEVDGDRFSEEEVIANAIVTMVGGQETTTNLIGNGLLALLRNPDQWELLRTDPTLVPSAIEELLRYESPSQHTARLAPADAELGGKHIRERQAVIAVMGAANRDPARFPEPDRLDIRRTDNRHLAFGGGAHHCFGAALARLESQLAFSALTGTIDGMRLADQPLVWRQNQGLRGLESLHVEFARAA